MTDHSVHLVFIVANVFSGILCKIGSLVLVQETTVHGHQHVLDISYHLVSQLSIWNSIRLLSS